MHQAFEVIGSHDDKILSLVEGQVGDGDSFGAGLVHSVSVCVVCAVDVSVELVQVKGATGGLVFLVGHRFIGLFGWV
ncbi:MAG: hypothetical protein AAF571_10460 [Verrucomicrobiota bacterium]